jgi:hypothetical protein
VSTIQEEREEIEEETGKGTGKLTVHKRCQEQKATKKKLGEEGEVRKEGR